MQCHIFLEGTKTQTGPPKPLSPALARQQVPDVLPSALGILEIAHSKPVDPSKDLKKMCFFKDCRET